MKPKLTGDEPITWIIWPDDVPAPWPEARVAELVQAARSAGCAFLVLEGGVLAVTAPGKVITEERRARLRLCARSIVEFIVREVRDGAA